MSSTSSLPGSASVKRQNRFSSGLSRQNPLPQGTTPKSPVQINAPGLGTGEVKGGAADGERVSAPAQCIVGMPAVLNVRLQSGNLLPGQNLKQPACFGKLGTRWCSVNRPPNLPASTSQVTYTSGPTAPVDRAKSNKRWTVRGAVPSGPVSTRMVKSI